MMKKFCIVLVLLAFVSGSVVGQSTNPNITDEQIAQTERGRLGVIAVPNWNQGFNAYINSGLLGSTVTLDIDVLRDGVEQKATVRVSHKFPKDSLLRLSRIDFLAPEELVGDVYIIRLNEDDRREFDVFFWNPGLVSPLKVNGHFEVFGDASIFETMGLLVRGADGKYWVTFREFSEEVPTVPNPEYTLTIRSNTGQNLGRVTKEAPLAEITVEPIPARLESEPFPMIKVFAFLNSALYRMEFRDADGDLIHTHHYDWREFDSVPSGSYATQYTIENHIIPGSFTTISVRDIQVGNHPDELFDPNLLGQ
jgi:hypothetical protein